MRLRLRLLLLLLSSLWKKPLGILDESVLNLIVLPNDIDVRKISDDRYLALMDLGRMDVAFRVGLLRPMLKNGWLPLATFCTIRYRHPLKAFQRFQLKTRIVWWSESTAYWQQVFERKGRVVATAYVCATLLSRHGAVPSGEIFRAIGQAPTRPDQPEIVARLREMESLIHETQTEKTPQDP